MNEETKTCKIRRLVSVIAEATKELDRLTTGDAPKLPRRDSKKKRQEQMREEYALMLARRGIK